jgi:RimJ/RimL family protein N-acetyltransferase
VRFPTLTSRLVKLRQLRSNDIPTIRLLVTNEITKYLIHVPYPYKTEDARRFVNKSRRYSKSRKELVFGIELLRTSSLVGIISLQKIENVSKNAQIGYWVGKKYWNAGIATESIRLLIRYAFQILRLHKLYANVLVTNRASIRVLEKNGMKIEGLLKDSVYKDHKFYDVALYYILNRP